MIAQDIVPLSETLALVGIEAARATRLHGDFNSPHEGYAVILEELDELWEHVRANTTKSKECREECIQIAAMAVKFIKLTNE